MKGYTKKGLIETMRKVKSDPHLIVVFTTFGLYDMTSAQYIKWFRECLTDKINRNEKPAGKKDSKEYFYNALRIQHKLNSNIVIRETDFNFDKKLGKRLSHKIFNELD